MTGKELRAIRKGMGLTQVGFAERIRVARNSVVRSLPLPSRQEAIEILDHLRAKIAERDVKRDEEKIKARKLLLEDQKRILEIDKEAMKKAVESIDQKETGEIQRTMH